MTMTQLVEDRESTWTSLSRMVLPGRNGQPWLDEMRRQAAARFEAVGLPSTKDEEWRFTNVAPLGKIPFRPAEAEREADAAAVAGRFTFGAGAAVELVFVNGRLAPTLSRMGSAPGGVRVGSLAQALHDDAVRVRRHLGQYARIENNPLAALNTASLTDGAYIHLARGASAAGPIHLLFVSVAGGESAVCHPRVLVVADDGSEATIVESYVGAEGGDVPGQCGHRNRHGA